MVSFNLESILKDDKVNTSFSLIIFTYEYYAYEL